MLWVQAEKGGEVGRRKEPLKVSFFFKQVLGFFVVKCTFFFFQKKAVLRGNGFGEVGRGSLHLFLCFCADFFSLCPHHQLTGANWTSPKTMYLKEEKPKIIFWGDEVKKPVEVCDGSHPKKKEETLSRFESF